MNEYMLRNIDIGTEASFTKTVTVEMENSFRELSGDDNPLHKDDAFARNISNGKYKCHVAFGMLTASLYSTMAGMYLPGRYSLIHSFDELSFINPVFVGDELEISGKVIDKNEELRLILLKVEIKNQDKKVVSRAKMKVLVMK